MIRKFFLVPAVLSLGCVLFLADAAHAQRRGGARVYSGARAGNWNGGYYRGGYYGGGYYGNRYYRGYGYYPGYGYGYYPYGYGIGAGLLGLGRYGYGGYGGYGGSGYSYPSTTSYSGYYDPSSQQPAYTDQSPPNNAEIRVLVPDPQARVWFDGNPTQQTGTERWFYTPPLQAGANNTYRVRASWMQGGQEVTQEKVVNVNPGQSTTVAFAPTSGTQTPPQPGGPETLEGRIVRTGNDQFVVQTSDKREIIVYTNPQTRFMLNQNPGAFTDVRVGNNVQINVMRQGDRRNATIVTIRP